MAILDALVKPRSRSFLPKDGCVMNEILTVPPLLQLSSTEDVVTFVHVRSLLRKLGRQYKTRSALFFVQMFVVVALLVVIKLGNMKNRTQSEAAHDGFNFLILGLTAIAVETLVIILFHGAKLNYSSKLIGDHLYAQENGVRRDISGKITKSQVLNTALHLDLSLIHI